MIKGLLSLGHRKAVHEDVKSSAHK
jgi:hypothetical protein